MIYGNHWCQKVQVHNVFVSIFVINEDPAAGYASVSLFIFEDQIGVSSNIVA